MDPLGQLCQFVSGFRCFNGVKNVSQLCSSVELTKAIVLNRCQHLADSLRQTLAKKGDLIGLKSALSPGGLEFVKCGTGLLDIEQNHSLSRIA